MRLGACFTWVLSVVLIGTGFGLGYFYVPGGSLFSQDKTVTWAAPSILAETPPFIFNMSVDLPWEQGTVEDAIFPAQVEELDLKSVVSGEEALEHARQIHGDDAKFNKVYIPFYSSADKQAMIWVIEFDSAFAAKQHFKRINDRLTDAHDHDSLNPFFLQDVEVYHLQACNMYNYYYRKANHIYWVSLVTNVPLPLFLNFYEHF